MKILKIKKDVYNKIAEIRDLLRKTDRIEYSDDSILYVSLNNELKRLRRENANRKKLGRPCKRCQRMFKPSSKFSLVCNWCKANDTRKRRKKCKEEKNGRT